MNKQGKLVEGKVVGGIEWTKLVLPDGAERRGATHNPVAGCWHDCQWTMPDGTIAECYAKTVAEGLAQANYPHGFRHHYWRPELLEIPLRYKEPMRIFWDSMADLFGHWVPDEQIEAVLDMARRASWHTFQSLTKNAPRLLRFDIPPNVWVGVSSPPDFMWHKAMTRQAQERMLEKSLRILSQIKNRVTWMSFEPLSWDVSGIVARHPGALRWAVIGAASNGPQLYQPDAAHVQALLDVLNRQDVRVFFKGNLIWKPWREEFPESV